jgi:hypothetical protein
MTEDEPGCVACCVPKGTRNTQQTLPVDATATASGVQQAPLKALAMAILARNMPCNTVQQMAEKPCNKTPEKGGAFVAYGNPVVVHVACIACRHLDGTGHCGVRNYWPIYPHLPIRLCGKYEAR